MLGLRVVREGARESEAELADKAHENRFDGYGGGSRRSGIAQRHDSVAVHGGQVGRSRGLSKKSRHVDSLERRNYFGHVRLRLAVAFGIFDDVRRSVGVVDDLAGELFDVGGVFHRLGNSGW